MESVTFEKKALGSFKAVLIGCSLGCFIVSTLVIFSHRQVTTGSMKATGEETVKGQLFTNSTTMLDLEPD